MTIHPSIIISCAFNWNISSPPYPKCSLLPYFYLKLLNMSFNDPSKVHYFITFTLTPPYTLSYSYNPFNNKKRIYRLISSHSTSHIHQRPFRNLLILLVKFLVCVCLYRVIFVDIRVKDTIITLTIYILNVPLLHFLPPPI